MVAFNFRDTHVRGRLHHARRWSHWHWTGTARTLIADFADCGVQVQIRVRSQLSIARLDLRWNKRNDLRRLLFGDTRATLRLCHFLRQHVAKDAYEFSRVDASSWQSLKLTNEDWQQFFKLYGAGVVQAFDQKGCWNSNHSVALAEKVDLNKFLYVNLDKLFLIGVDGWLFVLVFFRLFAEKSYKVVE